MCYVNFITDTKTDIKNIEMKTSRNPMFFAHILHELSGIPPSVLHFENHWASPIPPPSPKSNRNSQTNVL